MMLWPLYKTYALNLSQFYDRKFVSLSGSGVHCFLTCLVVRNPRISFLSV